jgi:hypothetical protein
MTFMSQVASKKKCQLHLMYFLHWLCPKEWTSSTITIAMLGDAKFSPATTSRLMRIVETGPTYFFTTIVFKSVATKFCQVW